MVAAAIGVSSAVRRPFLNRQFAAEARQFGSNWRTFGLPIPDHQLLESTTGNSFSRKEFRSQGIPHKLHRFSKFASS
jgi:hypothetical protein